MGFGLRSRFMGSYKQGCRVPLRVLEGSTGFYRFGVATSGVIRPQIWATTIVTPAITPLIANPEPPSRAAP